jgi:hypothetical protein
MKSKTIITTVLLLFIITSFAYLVFKEVRSTSQSDPTGTNMPAIAEPNEPSSETMAQKVIVYYFYSTARCATCRKFEAFSNEALHESFEEALNDGRLQWRMVNVEKPGNEHFVTDYKLYSKSIVIVKMQDGKQVEWKNLQKIWELVRDKKVFIKYVQDEIRNYLETG